MVESFDEMLLELRTRYDSEFIDCEKKQKVYLLNYFSLFVFSLNSLILENKGVPQEPL